MIANLTTTTAARSRNKNGRFRQKRADTHLGTLEKQYGEISDRRSDCHLGTIRTATGKSLTQLVKGRPEVTHEPGINGRTRNQDGALRAKRGDTHMASLAVTYGAIAGVPGNLHLAVLRALTGHSLNWMVHHKAAVREAVAHQTSP
jgi:hypothetical protein